MFKYESDILGQGQGKECEFSIHSGWMDFNAVRLDETIKRLNDIESEDVQDWKPGNISNKSGDRRRNK